MVTVLLAIDTVYKQMFAIPPEKKGNGDPFASRSLAAFARYVGTPQSDHPRRLGGTHSWQSSTTHCALLTAATPRTSPVNSKGSNGAAERAVQIR